MTIGPKWQIMKINIFKIHFFMFDIKLIMVSILLPRISILSTPENFR